MVTLDDDTIDAIRKIQEAVKNTNFEVNRFDVGDSAIQERQVINLDIRRKVNKEEKTK